MVPLFTSVRIVEDPFLGCRACASRYFIRGRQANVGGGGGRESGNEARKRGKKSRRVYGAMRMMARKKHWEWGRGW